ncbi:TonB-dependent receptor plug domain-containing protein [Proteobacteria bacterium 005FR1]|nr:TonB-dependent receptor plug domain-containing protein [Proteobacteria bacterium 005FR1]
MKLNPIYRGILCCTLAIPAGTALAQEAIEEIVVTGSLIKGTPEDAALPVEVHTAADMNMSGAPSALEFAKTLTSQGPVDGEAYYFGGAEDTGNVQFNLRGLGSDKTLSLFNGRRVNQNTSIIPSIALQRVEVLKDGAAVTYGADATGGVVNFITRDFYEGFEVDASYKYIDGSDGDYSTSIMGGFGGDDTNIIWAAEWEHRSELDTTDRDFSHTPYTTNPVPWSSLTNLSSWVAHGPLPTVPTTETRELIPGSGLNLNTGEFGPMYGFVRDYTTESCEAVGGVEGKVSCMYNYAPYYNIVEDNDIYRLYGQVTSAVSDSMDFHLRLAFSRVHTPAAEGSPSQPVIRGTALNEGYVTQFYVPRTNPYWGAFADRTGLSSNPYYAGIQGASALLYRGFAHGGNPTFAQGNNSSAAREIDNKYWHLSTGLDGTFENGVGYDFGITYNHATLWNDDPDIIAYRLQEAMNGFGGPNCNAQDLDPNRFGTQNAAAAGQNGCMWFNPFASNFTGQPILGLDNPSYIDGAENSAELVNWLFDPRAEETIDDDITVDLVLNGGTGLELPGGEVAWGAGLQWRKRHRREVVESDFYNGAQPCVWPNRYGQVPRSPSDPEYNGCTPDEPGPFQFFGTNPPDRNSQDQKSAFAEFNFPVLDNVVMTAAARYEEFSGGLDATVYKVSGKWDISYNLSLRGSYGTNYQAPGITVTPGEVNNGVSNYSVADGSWLGSTTVTRSDIEPETATVWSTGLIWQSEGFTSGSDFRVILDYYDIQTEDELGLLASTNDIAAAVFADGKTNCDHPLANRVTFNGACVNGADPNFASITTDYGNGPGQHTSGVDLQINYGFPFLKGDLDFGLTATRVLEDENDPAEIDGYQLDSGDDRLGDLNYETIAFASSEWRANFSTNYSQDIHNFRLVLNYISGVDDERYDAENFASEQARTAALTAGGVYTDWGVKGDDWLVADFHYNVELPWDTTISASIQNLTDEDPPESRQELGYDPRVGNPLGRTFELGFTKRF